LGPRRRKKGNDEENCIMRSSKFTSFENNYWKNHINGDENGRTDSVCEGNDKHKQNFETTYKTKT
jgi:hypothetical protein